MGRKMDGMQQILVYADSLSWGIIPDTRSRLRFDKRWPGVMENALNRAGAPVRVIEDCLNGRRTVWDDPFKQGRNGLQGLEQRMEINAPLALVIVLLGTNDFQCMHQTTAWQSAQGIKALVSAMRCAPVEPGMPVPPILLVAPPQAQKAKGAIAPKFEGAELKSMGLAHAIEAVAHECACHFLDAGSVTPVSRVDGVHLDEDQHALLGLAIAKYARALLG